MEGVSFLLPIEFDLAATFLAALTGVWAASRRGYDLVGAFMLALVTSVGGGLLRDSVFIAQVPLVMQDARYLGAISAALVVGALTYRWSERVSHLFSYTDALAMGVYGVYGANWALISGIAPVASILVGLCNAVGGGLIRDVLVREEPLMFKPGQLYAIAAAAGCTLYVALSQYSVVNDEHAAWIAIAVTLALRVLAVRFNWTTTAVREWWQQRKDPGPGS
ncbi:MAG TPA: TRIC cation channel family protein [Burkholderiales bacterium]|nr:TRIC cation channel family protein [Burkholderiales bacterium]